MSKITVIGAGSVGATIANDLMIQGIASEIVLIDVNKQKAFGEAMDIYQGAPFCSPTIVRSGDYDAASGSDIVIITSGLPRKAGQSRLELAQANVNIIKDIAPQITAAAPDAIYIIVSNPVDVLTYVFHKISGVPESHIIGSGTILDTSRLQSTLAKRFCISPKNVHAHVYGEHGDSSFVPWSLVHIANNHIDSYKEHSPDCDRIKWNQDYEEIEQFVKTSGAQVIKNKGATFYAVAMSVCHLCKCVQSTAGTALTVSTMMHGEYGVSDVCLSTLALVDNQGVRGKILNQLTDGEIDKLRASAEKLKKEYSVREPNMSIAVSPCEVETDAMTDGDREMLLDLMTLLPDGLRSTHQTFEHTLGSTSNVGVLETRQDEVELAVTIRSTDTKRFYNYQQLKRLCARLGVKTELICELPEWEYSVSDEWMEMLRKMYPEYPPYYLGGTGEIGFFTTRIPGLNAVSLTPNAFNCHSTQEYLSIRECRYFYDKMVELLEKMKDM